MAKPEMSHFSKFTEDYLKAIWEGTRDGPVTTRVVATTLGVSDASVSAMLAKLSDLGLVEHTRYHGARLTAEGERQALQLLS